MRNDLSGKTVLVTGASSGIGRAICVACAQAGARLVLIARDVARLEETREGCAGGAHVVWPADLSDLDGVPKLIRSICEEHGPLSGLVHSAGLHQLKPLRVLKRSDMETLFSLNAAAGVMLVKGLSGKGNYGPGASAVLISSVMARVAQSGAIAYCMSKAAVESAARAMALELLPQEIRVNCVAPAMVETAMAERALRLLGPEQSERILRQHPMGLGKPEDVAGAVCFLLSDASRYVTGSCLVVDGGYSAQ